MAVLSGSVNGIASFDRGLLLVTRTPRALSLLWLCTLPVRLVTMVLVLQVVALRGDARMAASTLEGLALLATLAWPLSIWGRGMYVRACRLTVAGGPPTWRVLVAVPWTHVATQLHAALVLELVFWATLPLVVVAPLVPPLAAVAAATAPTAGLGWWKPLRALGLPAGFPALALASAAGLFGVVLVTLNLYVVVMALLGACSAIGLPVAEWTPLLTPRHPLFDGLLVVGGTVAMEPVFLAIVVAIVDQAYARSSGEDLRQWFAVLRTRADATDGAADTVTSGAAGPSSAIVAPFGPAPATPAAPG